MRISPTDKTPYTSMESNALTGVEACVHCGLCLPVCPTYEEWKTSMDSPRGRLLLMKAAAENQIPISDKFVLHMERCLGCRACESACPSGVRFGHAMEKTRAVIQRVKAQKGKTKTPETLRNRIISKIILNKLFMYSTRAHTLGWVFRGYQKSGLQFLIRYSGILTKLRIRGVPLGTLEGLLPERHLDMRPLPKSNPAKGQKRGQVILFTGCVMNFLFRKVHWDTIRCLTTNGYEVIVPEKQSCCGALHAHAGEADYAYSLALQNMKNLQGDVPVVVNAAGCGSMMKDYCHSLSGSQDSERFSHRVRDIHEFLARIDLRSPLNEFPEKVAYQDACHLAHGQSITRAPRDLLCSIPGLELVALPRSDWCCGSAGTYNLTQPEAANRLLEKKIDAIASTGAKVLAVGNPGCALQIEMGLRQHGLSIRVMHPVEILADAYGRK